MIFELVSLAMFEKIGPLRSRPPFFVIFPASSLSFTAFDLGEDFFFLSTFSLGFRPDFFSLARPASNPPFMLSRVASFARTVSCALQMSQLLLLLSHLRLHQLEASKKCLHLRAPSSVLALHRQREQVR